MPDTKMTETDLYFQGLQEDRASIEKAYQYLLSAVDQALSVSDYKALLPLIPYIEEGEGVILFRCFDRIYRLLRILHITALELKYHQPLFAAGCHSAQDLTDKYILTMFAFRRILFRLSDDSVNDAIYYLQQHPISYLAVCSLTQDELILPDQAFYEDIASLYLEMEIWSPSDVQQLFAMINSK